MTVDRTFVIVDLAGFTSATQAHGDDAAADLAEELIGLATQSLGDGDVLVKSIGDAVLCACVDPVAGVKFVRSMLTSSEEIAGFPLLRSGLHHGSASPRGDDFFGAGVNLAARVADLAGGGQVLATSEVADAGRTLGVRVTELGPYTLKNIDDPVDLFELDLCSTAHGHTIDPVCRMRVDRDLAAGRLRHEGVEHWFCTLDCVAKFAARPDRYTS